MPTPFVPVLDPEAHPRPHEVAPRGAWPSGSAWQSDCAWTRDRARPSDSAAPGVEHATAAMQRPVASMADVATQRRDHPPALAPFAEYLSDPDVTDVFVNGASGLWVDRGAGAERDPLWSADEATVRELAVALIAAGGRHLDDACPCVDVRLHDGIRVHAVLAPIATDGPLISLRVPRLHRPRLGQLHSAGTLGDDAVLAWLEELVADRANVLITGAAGSGKTTLLSALLSEAPQQERIVTIEDVAELQIAHPHHIALEARQANLEGVGEVGLARLVREALRMRPERIVLGECRGAEIRELLGALNTGHDGGAGTLHANGLADVPARLEALGALSGLDDHALARQAVSAIDVVLHLERDAHGVRRLSAAGRLVMDDGRLAVREETPWRG